MGTPQNVFDAISANDVDRLQQLLDADPALASARSDAGVSALMTAAYHRNAEMVNLLRAAGPALDVFEATTLGDTAPPAGTAPEFRHWSHPGPPTDSRRFILPPSSTNSRPRRN